MSHNGDEYAAVRAAEVKEAALAHVSAAHREAEAHIANRLEMISVALSFGATWGELGDAMGVSRQTAHRRFGRSVR